MNFVYDIYRSCGLVYSCWFFVCVVTALLILLLWTRPSSQIRGWHVAAISLLPLAVGLYGWLDGYLIVRAACAAGRFDPEGVAEGFRQARLTAWFGGSLSVVLLVLQAIASRFKPSALAGCDPQADR